MDEYEQKRLQELKAMAPIKPRGIWERGTLSGHDVFFLCGTIGQEFDIWQRRVSLMSASDAYFSQKIGLDAVEAVMDEIESQIKDALLEGERIRPRWSPGYGDHPLSLSIEILNKLNASKRIGVSITETMLLVPSKSVTAICEIIK